MRGDLATASRSRCTVPRSRRRRRPAGRRRPPGGPPRSGLRAAAEDVSGRHTPWYLPTWVNRPEAGDIADRPEPLPAASGVDRDATRIGLDAHGLEPDALQARPRPVATRSRSPRSSPPSRTRDVSRHPAGARGGGPEASARCRLSVGPRRARRPAPPAPGAQDAFADQGHRRPPAGDRLRHLDADRPAAEHQQGRGHSVMPGRLAVRPRPVELHGGRARAGSPGPSRCDTMCSAVYGRPSTSTPRPSEAAGPRSTSMPLSPAFRLPGVAVVRDHEVAPRQGRLDVDLRAPGASRAPGPPHPGAAGSSRGCTPSTSAPTDQLALDNGDPQPALSQAPRRSARPGAPPPMTITS